VCIILNTRTSQKMDIIQRNIYIKDTSYILTENVFGRSNFGIMGSSPILDMNVVCLASLPVLPIVYTTRTFHLNSDCEQPRGPILSWEEKTVNKYTSNKYCSFKWSKSSKSHYSVFFLNLICICAMCSECWRSISDLPEGSDVSHAAQCQC
jgi:hypothetical protein